MDLLNLPLHETENKKRSKSKTPTIRKHQTPHAHPKNKQKLKTKEQRNTHPKTNKKEPRLDVRSSTTWRSESTGEWPVGSLRRWRRRWRPWPHRAPPTLGERSTRSTGKNETFNERMGVFVFFCKKKTGKTWKSIDGLLGGLSKWMFFFFFPKNLRRKASRASFCAIRC